MSVRFPSNASWSLFSNCVFLALISVTFKSLKPSATFALSVQPADSIASIKEQLLVAHPNAPPPDAQRLLFKGKALSDSKLLQEYAVKDGDVINLMLKPGTNWDPSKPTESTPPQMATPTPVNPFASVGGSLDPQASRSSRHQRIPSVVLSPSPSNDGTLPDQKDIVLTVDAGLITSPSSSPEKTTTYQTILAKPEFWYNLLNQFLRYVAHLFTVAYTHCIIGRSLPRKPMSTWLLRTSWLLLKATSLPAKSRRFETTSALWVWPAPRQKRFACPNFLNVHLGFFYS